jgi:hypothetical protein
VNRFRLSRKPAALLTVLAFGAASAPAHAIVPPAAQASSAAQSRLSIDHDPLPCVTTAVAPAVDALVNPGPEVSLSRVLYRATQTPFFYYAVMEGLPPSLEGVLPRVEETTRGVEYHIEAVDRLQLSRQTPDYVAPVVASNVCKAKGVPVPPAGLGLTVGLTDAKAPPVPQGFKKEDIAFVILLSGATVTVAEALRLYGGGGGGAAAPGGGAASSAGGGISTGVWIGAGVAAAAGIGVAVANANKNSTATHTPTATPTQTPTITPVPFQFVEAEATWSGPGNVDIRIDATQAGAPVRIEAGCESTTNRTERTVLQGRSVPSGHYQIKLKATRCPGDTGPDSITTLVSVRYGLESSPSTFSRFVPIATDGTEVTVLEFNLP